MTPGAWKDHFQGHLDGSETDRAALYEALADESAQDAKALEEFLAMRELNFLLSSELSPSASDAAFINGVCGVLKKSQKPSNEFVLEVVNKNEKRRTTAILLKKKQRVQWSAVAAMFLLAVGLVWILVGRTSTNTPSDVANRELTPVGHIVLLERPGTSGAVMISRKSAKGVADLAARTGDVLYREDVLVAKADAETAALAEMVLKDVGTVQIFPATKVDVSALEASYLLQLNAGKLVVNVPALVPPKTFSIRTPHAIATVLGTRFGLVATATETRLEVYESKVRMQLVGPDGSAIGTGVSSAVVEAGFSALTGREALTISALPRQQYVAEIREGVNGYAGTQDGTISTQRTDMTKGNGLTYFDDPEVLVTKLANYEKRALIRFDGLTLPAGAKLEAAELELWFENFNGDQGVKGVYMLAEWNPGAKGPTGLGWLHRDAGIKWSEPGCGAADWVPGKTFELRGFTDGYEIKNTVALDLELVRGWIEKPVTNLGVMLIALDSNKPLRMQTSKNPKVNLRPLLRLTYSAPAGSVPAESQKNPVKTLQRETF